MSAISSNASAASASKPSGSDRYGSLTSGDFLKVMFTELTRQDPLQPSQSKDLMEQIATIRSIESNLSLSETLKTVVRQNEVAGAGSLVGQTVKGVGDNGASLDGVVRSVSITREGISLNLLDGSRLPLKNVQEILGFMLDDSAFASQHQGN